MNSPIFVVAISILATTASSSLRSHGREHSKQGAYETRGEQSVARSNAAHDRSSLAVIFRIRSHT